MKACVSCSKFNFNNFNINRDVFSYLLTFLRFTLLLLNTEGVQLLCLIDKGLDACRYLQTYGEWDRAAWLAKVTRLSQHQYFLHYASVALTAPHRSDNKNE